MAKPDKLGFTGVFIPAKIYLDKTISPVEKLLLAQVDALSTETGFCWAANAHFAEQFGCSTANISKHFKHLETRGILRIEFEGEFGQGRKICIVRGQYFGETPKPQVTPPLTQGYAPPKPQVTPPLTQGLTERELKFKDENQEKINSSAFSEKSEKRPTALKVETFEMKTETVFLNDEKIVVEKPAGRADDHRTVIIEPPPAKKARAKKEKPARPEEDMKLHQPFVDIFHDFFKAEKDDVFLWDSRQGLAISNIIPMLRKKIEQARDGAAVDEKTMMAGWRHFLTLMLTKDPWTVKNRLTPHHIASEFQSIFTKIKSDAKPANQPRQSAIQQRQNEYVAYAAKQQFERLARENS